MSVDPSLPQEMVSIFLSGYTDTCYRWLRDNKFDKIIRGWIKERGHCLLVSGEWFKERGILHVYHGFLSWCLAEA